MNNIESLRAFCNSLPGVTEDIKWEKDLCFCVGGKMFCVTSLDGEFQFSFKVKDEEFDEVSQRGGVVPAPYLARAKWVLVTTPSGFKKKELENFVQNSYEMIRAKLPKKVQQEIQGSKKARHSTHVNEKKG